jgi:hypothetical protein
MDQNTKGVKALNQKAKDTPFSGDRQTNGRDIDKINLNEFVQDGDTVRPVKPLDDYEHLRITKEKYIPHYEPVVKIGGKGIAARGNITGISAQVKAGKTAICSVILAGAISAKEYYDGFAQLTVEPNTKGKAVINGDTEQAEDDQQYNLNTILKRVELERTPDFFLSYNLRQLSRKDYQQTLNAICESADARFNGIHLITIDGGADFCKSVNDDVEAGAVVEYFSHLAIKYDCPVIIVIHQNPGSDKERGHLGSEIQRKCYGLLSISKTGDVSTLQVKVGRKAGTMDTPTINYSYDPERGYHTECVAPDSDTKADEKRRAKFESIADAVFKGKKGLKYTDAVSAIMQVTSKGERTAKGMISDLAGWGYLNKKDDGSYRLSVQGAKKCKEVQNCTSA